jgi:hypothetical protein
LLIATGASASLIGEGEAPPKLQDDFGSNSRTVELERVDQSWKKPPSASFPPGSLGKDPKGTPTTGAGRPAPGDGENAKPDPEKDSDPCPRTGKPVVLATGEKLKTEPDFSASSLYGISLTRTYRSQHATGTVFGAHWTSSLDSSKVSYNLTNCIRLEESVCMPRNATVVNADGSTYIWS